MLNVSMSKLSRGRLGETVVCCCYISLLHGSKTLNSLKCWWVLHPPTYTALHRLLLMLNSNKSDAVKTTMPNVSTKEGCIRYQIALHLHCESVMCCQAVNTTPPWKEWQVCWPLTHRVVTSHIFCTGSLSYKRHYLAAPLSEWLRSSKLMTRYPATCANELVC